MMESLAFVAIAVCILGFGMISGRVQKSVVTPPMVFVVFGLLLSNRILGLVEFEVGSKFIETLAKLTLVLVLFTDAARIDLACLRREHNLPVRLLVIGLPLTILFGALVAAVLFDLLSFWEGAVLAAILAPTDAALGQAVVNNSKVPVRIRQTLNVESGLNDGIALPVVLIMMSLAGAAEGSGSVEYWVQFAALQVVLGPVVGISVGFAGGKLVEFTSRTGWMNRSFQDLSALGISLLAFGSAELVGGNGFIAAFSAGLTLGNTSRPICSCLYEFAEAEGQLLTLLIFTIFGAIMVPIALDHLNWHVILYGLLSLTLIRMVPVAVSLIGGRLQLGTIVFLGWFGPRGIASILFALLVLEESRMAGREEILSIVVATVFLSVFVHGLSAFPAANRYAKWAEEMKSEPGMEEHLPLEEMPVRLPYAEPSS